jgi:hypothetical protein
MLPQVCDTEHSEGKTNAIDEQIHSKIELSAAKREEIEKEMLEAQWNW